MNTHPDEPVPADMPPDLDRVYAALKAPLDPAPDALLDRILASRAEGARSMLPVDARRRSRLRRRMVPVAIAAALALVALGIWSTVANHRDQQNRFVEGDAWDFGLVTASMAQSTTKSKYPPIRFDVSRLHPVSLTYTRRSFRNNERATERWTGTYTLAPIVDGRQGWYLITQSKFERPAPARQNFWRSSVDTLRLDPVRLEPLEVISRLEYQDGRWRRNSYQIMDTLITLHSTRHGPLIGADLNRPETYDSAFPIPHDALPRVVQRSQWMVVLMAAPLGRGWKGSLIHLPLTDPVSAFSTDFAVIGEEQVVIASGRQDCWKLSLRFGGSLQLTLLVRKRDGVLVREQMVDRQGRDTITDEMVLIAER